MPVDMPSSAVCDTTGEGCGALARPGVGVLPSLNAFAIAEAFHLEYVIFSLTCIRARL